MLITGIMAFRLHRHGEASRERTADAKSLPCHLPGHALACQTIIVSFRQHILSAYRIIEPAMRYPDQPTRHAVASVQARNEGINLLADRSGRHFLWCHHPHWRPEPQRCTLLCWVNRLSLPCLPAVPENFSAAVAAGRIHGVVDRIGWMPCAAASQRSCEAWTDRCWEMSALPNFTGRQYPPCTRSERHRLIRSRGRRAQAVMSPASSGVLDRGGEPEA